MWALCLNFRISSTYHCLNHIGKVISHCNKQSSHLGIIRADLVDPAQNQWTCTFLWYGQYVWGVLYVAFPWLTPTLASQYTAMRPFMPVYKGSLSRRELMMSYFKYFRQYLQSFKDIGRGCFIWTYCDNSSDVDEWPTSTTAWSIWNPRPDQTHTNQNSGRWKRHLEIMLASAFWMFLENVSQELGAYSCWSVALCMKFQELEEDLCWSSSANSPYLVEEYHCSKQYKGKLRFKLVSKMRARLLRLRRQQDSRSR